MNETRWTAALLVVALGCGGSASPGAHSGTTPGPEPAEDASAASLPEGQPKVEASLLTDGLVVNGSLDEWLPSEDAQVLLSLRSDGMAVALKLPAQAEGVSLAISSRFLDYPDLGWIARSGHTITLTEHSCKVEQVPAGEGEWRDGQPHPPEVATACLALLQRHKTDAAVFREKFVARFRISKTGVTTALGAPIAGAKHAARGGVVEVHLPLSAAPAFIVAPVTELMVHATYGKIPDDLALPVVTADHTKKPDARWTQMVLLEPAAFAPHAEVREVVFEPPVFGPFGWTAQHYYHPTMPNVVHWLDTPIGTSSIAFGDNAPPRIAVVKEKRALYRRLETMGGVEVGAAAERLLIVKKGGEIVDHEHGLGELRGVVFRNGQLHLVSYHPPAFSVMRGGTMPPRWSVLGVSPTGKVTPGLEGDYWDGSYSWRAWDEDPEPFADRDFHMFGMKGQRQGKPKTVRWIWHPEPKRYEVTVEPASQRAEP